MDKKYNYKEFKNDPLTSYNGHTPRYLTALFGCIDNKKTSIEEIFTAIDNIYKTGKHHSPSDIKNYKRRAIKLLNQFIFD